jgi:hypothetical protein
MRAFASVEIGLDLSRRRGAALNLEQTIDVVAPDLPPPHV